MRGLASASDAFINIPQKSSFASGQDMSSFSETSVVKMSLSVDRPEFACKKRSESLIRGARDIRRKGSAVTNASSGDIQRKSTTVTEDSDAFTEETLSTMNSSEAFTYTYSGASRDYRREALIIDPVNSLMEAALEVQLITGRFDDCSASATNDARELASKSSNGEESKSYETVPFDDISEAFTTRASGEEWQEIFGFGLEEIWSKTSIVPSASSDLQRHHLGSSSSTLVSHPQPHKFKPEQTAELVPVHEEVEVELLDYYDTSIQLPVEV